MKKLVITFISLYQKFISPLLHQVLGTRYACRYLPTCSEYAKIHITQDGILIGLTKSFLRLCYCQPFVKKLPVALQK